MRLTFLGTSAGESYPAIWCDCPNCTYAREHGGRNIRMNTGTLLDRDTLLDMNSCGFYTAASLGISLTGIRNLLVTHPHPDHLTAEPLAWREGKRDALEGSGQVRLSTAAPRFTPLPVMTMYGNRHVRAWLEMHPELLREDRRLRFCEIREGERVEAEGLAFTPVRARHGQVPGFAHSFIIEREGKTLLYALDTGGYDADMLSLILSRRYDAVVIEGTFGLSAADDPNHMNRDKDLCFRDSLRSAGCIGGATPFVLTHMSPHWTPPHDVYAPMMAREGITVAYDGMTIEF